MEGGRPEKFSLFLIVLGFVIGATGAALTFLWSPSFSPLFYIGFLITIIGLAFAVLYRLEERKK